MANASVIQWLLDADPSIRWQAMQDLLEHERAVGGNPDLTAARLRGQEYLLDRHLFDHQDGELLGLASKSFDVFVTVDRNLSFQQNLPSFAIAVIVLRARTNRISDLQALVPDLLASIPTAKPGVVTYVGM